MDEFTSDLLAAIDTAQTRHNIRQMHLRKMVEAYGGVPAAKEYLKKKRPSDGFDDLKQAGCLNLSMEALIVSKKYHALFTDTEINACFSLLCSADYYGTTL